MSRRKTEPYLSRYLHMIGNKNGLPIGGNFELTARCNFNCPMCYVHLNQKEMEAVGRELTAKEWIAIAREAKDQGMMFALLTGGEPFVRSDFFEIYHAMKEMGIIISINSNGSMIKGKILEELKADPPLRMNISLYGGCRETYRNMCGQDMFETVVHNIREIKEAEIDVRLNLSITPYNCQDLEKINKISRELGVFVKASAYMYPPIRIKEDPHSTENRLAAEEAAKYQLQWDKLRLTEEEYMQRMKGISRYEAVDEKECSMDIDEGVSCRAGHTSFWITWDGKMLPCGMMPYPAAYPLKDGFAKSWSQTKEETAKIRIPGKCTSCSKRKVCTVCASVCMAETGEYHRVPEYACRQTDEMIRRASEICRKF